MPADPHRNLWGKSPNPSPHTPLTPPVAEPIISRTRVGSLAIGCLVLAGVLKLSGPDQAGLMSAFFRVGTVLAALWLALPPKGQPVLWRNFAPVLVIALAFSLLTRNPKVLVVAIPVGFIVLLLLSFGSSRTSKRPRR